MSTNAEHPPTNNQPPGPKQRPSTEAETAEQATLLRRRRTIMVVAGGIVGGGILGSIAAFAVLDFIRGRRVDEEMKESEKLRRENERLMRVEMEKRQQQRPPQK